MELKNVQLNWLTLASSDVSKKCFSMMVHGDINVNLVKLKWYYNSLNDNDRTIVRKEFRFELKTDGGIVTSDTFYNQC